MTEDEIKAIADRLTPEQKAQLRPCAKNRTILPKNLWHWGKNSVLHRYPSPKLNGTGYKVRNYLGLTTPKV